MPLSFYTSVLDRETLSRRTLFAQRRAPM